MTDFHDAVDRIWEISQNEPMTVDQQIMKIMEELGELSEARLISVGLKDSDDSDEYKIEHVLEEGCDVVLMSISILVACGFTKDQVSGMIHKKLDKWRAKSRMNNATSDS